MRISKAGLALITRLGPNDDVEYLVQWSDTWQMYSLIGGHVEAGESYRDCCVREVAEELDLVPTEYVVTAEPLWRLEYEAFSHSRRAMTLYRVELFRVTLASPDVVRKVSLQSANRWLSESEIAKMMTIDGQPISEQVRTVFHHK
jgi:ADP-ribose pyrophosphatase YjhB (NUDIX family)